MACIEGQIVAIMKSKHDTPPKQGVNLRHNVVIASVAATPGRSAGDTPDLFQFQGKRRFQAGSLGGGGAKMRNRVFHHLALPHYIFPKGPVIFFL